MGGYCMGKQFLTLNARSRDRRAGAGTLGGVLCTCPPGHPLSSWAEALKSSPLMLAETAMVHLGILASEMRKPQLAGC